MLDKYKVQERSSVYYHKTQESTTRTMETNTIAADKHKSKSHHYFQEDRHPAKLALTQTQTTERPVLGATVSIEYDEDAWHLAVQKTLIRNRQNTHTIDHHNIGKAIFTVPKISSSFPPKANSTSLGPIDSSDLENSPWIILLHSIQ